MSSQITLVIHPVYDKLFSLTNFKLSSFWRRLNMVIHTLTYELMDRYMNDIVSRRFCLETPFYYGNRYQVCLYLELRSIKIKPSVAFLHPVIILKIKSVTASQCWNCWVHHASPFHYVCVGFKGGLKRLIPTSDQSILK